MNAKLVEDIEKGSKMALVKKNIINYYIHNGSSTIPELSKVLDLSVPTVTKVIAEMCEEGYLIDYGKLETTGGRHPNLYGLNPDAGFFVGVDIRQTSVNLGVINSKGEVVDMATEVPFEKDNSPESLDKLCKIIVSFIDKQTVDKSKIMNVNVNISGRVNPDSGYSYSLFFFDEKPLADLIAEKIGYHVTIDNDTRAMAYGEYLSGVVQGEQNILFVNISWGLAIGIIIDGRIYSGKSGFAGEFGHVKAFDNELICHCGKKGCLETEASGSAMHRRLLEEISKGSNSLLSKKVKDGKPIDMKAMLDAIRHEDVLCIEIIEEIGLKLGQNIASLINLFNPEVVVVGGSLSLAGDYLLAPIKTAVRKYSLNLVNRDSAIVLSKLGEKAGVMGACLLARTRLMEM